VFLRDANVFWQRIGARQWAAPPPTWGMCSPPLIVDDLLITNPGATNASLVALDLETGGTRWQSAGLPAAYSAFIRVQFGGRTQIVGYDQRSLGGWDPQSGKRFWQIAPPVQGDFNVPTPIAVNGGLLLATENNGTRFYQFDAEGRIIAKPSAHFPELSPDTASPVVSNGRVFGAKSGRLYCLDLECGLEPVWERDEENLGDHASFIADDERVLVVTLAGELILLDARVETCAVISRMRLFEEDVEMYSHPALVGTRLYARGGASFVCVELGEDEL
jgi:outer membrane protein assembly factor BamB